MAQESMPPQNLMLPLKERVSELLLRTHRGSQSEFVMPSSHWQNLNERAINSGDPSQAEQLHLRALEEAEQFGANDLRVAQSLFALGELHVKQGKVLAARKEFERCLTIVDKNNFKDTMLNPTLSELGFIYKAANENEKAEAMFFRFIENLSHKGRESSSKVGVARTQLALIYLKLGKPDLAQQQVKWIETLPPESRFWKGATRTYDLIQVYRQQGKHEKSLSLAEHLIVSRPGAYSHMILAETLADNKKFSEAEKAYKDALILLSKSKKEATSSDFVYRSYADFLSQRGREDEAKAYRKKVSSNIRPVEDP